MQIKIEIDNGYDKHGNVTEYKLSKLNIVKLSHPYTTKASKKHTSWFINLFNYMQAETLDKIIATETGASDDDFSLYLK